MLKVKLMPFGRKKLKHYRVVVVEEHSKVTGKPTAEVGQYHPVQNELILDKKAIKEWVAKGAQVTSAVAKLLEK